MEMQSPKYKVRVLTEDDLVWFVEVAAVKMLEDELKRPELVNREYLYNLVSSQLPKGTCWIVFHGEEPVGALGAILVPNVFNPDITTLAEMFWYVLPEHRETRAGALLLLAFEQRTREVADEATMSLLGSSTVSISSLERRGYELREFGFHKKNKER